MDLKEEIKNWFVEDLANQTKLVQLILKLREYVDIHAYDNEYKTLLNELEKFNEQRMDQRSILGPVLYFN